MGKIYEYIKKEEAHLAIYKVEDLKWLIENIFSKYPLLSDHQALRYEQLRIGITNNLKRLDTLDDLPSILVDKEKFITPLLYYDHTEGAKQSALTKQGRPPEAGRGDPGSEAEDAGRAKAAYCAPIWKNFRGSAFNIHRKFNLWFFKWRSFIYTWYK